MRKPAAIWVCILLIVGLFGPLEPAFAQQQEKRIALVVGNGAYAKAPLATAANDGGLIAQTLQAAGFDVVGARDLDADTLRRSFRDFVQKAQASGPDTVAMVYLAGYGVQLAGENYFIPVDSAIGRETDIPTEALRISDYARQLGSLPLKASIVVLDVARQQPFIEGGQPIAGGLALVEPEAGMLVAFNAAPGTVAPEEQGPYGIYAQSLAEMIRTGGLPLPELFDRVRLRVNDASKGAQVPWHAQKVAANFMFFDRAPDAPPQAPSDQVAAIRSRPIRELGARDAYAMALERDTLQGYDEFLAAYPSDPLAKRVRALAAARREAITWMRTYRADTPQAYWSYLRRYPQGPHAADARRRLAILTAPLEPPPAFAVIEYDVPPPPPEEIIYVDRPVLVFSDPYYDFAPPPPPPVYFLPPPPPDFVILAPPPPPIGLFILPQPLFVPIPVYVHAPVYVAPPPNNIIYANIHNTTVINNVINKPAPPPPGPLAPAPGQGGAPGDARFKGAIPVAAPGAASPALPPSVAQKATLIQQGKAPVPPSASINPSIKPGAPAAPGAAPVVQPANAPPVVPKDQPLPKANTLPAPGAKGTPPVPSATLNPTAKTATPPAPHGTTQPSGAAAVATPQGQPLPKANALPVPGTKGAPPAPAGAAGVSPAVNPNAKTVTPSAPQPGTKPAPGATLNAPASAAKPPLVKPPVAGAPKTPPALGGAAPTSRQGSISPPPPPPSSSTGKPPPGVTSVPKPPPSVQPAVRTPPPPSPRVATPSPPPPRLSAPPPPRVSAPPPPKMAAPSPPPPAPRFNAPPPPPPRVSAPPPPPPRMAAPPPPPPRIAAPPPPPRPGAPPPAAAKRCPPNVPKC